MKEVFICRQCNNQINGRGEKFCSHHCRQLWYNFNNNPAKTESVKNKISASRIGRPTTLGRTLPESQKQNISKGKLGKKHWKEWNEAIGMGVKKAGNIPPRNHHYRGEIHHNWKGGVSKGRFKDFQTAEYKSFRKSVLVRDNFTCQDCGIVKTKFHVHHILPYASHPHLRYDISNGITLCLECHYAKHRDSPRPIAI